MIKECTKQVRHNAIAHHPLTDAQPVPEQRSLPPANSPSFYTAHDAIWYGIALWAVGLCPLPASCAPGRAWEAEKSLTGVSTA